MGDFVEGIKVRRVPYGFILQVGMLLFVITFFLSAGNYFKKDFDFHTEEIIENNTPMVVPISSYADITVTATPDYNGS
jgi:hypothetical protein